MHKLRITGSARQYLAIIVRDCDLGPEERILFGCYIFNNDTYEPVFDKCIYDCCGPEEYILSAEMAYNRFHQTQEREN